MHMHTLYSEVKWGLKTCQRVKNLPRSFARFDSNFKLWPRHKKTKKIFWFDSYRQRNEIIPKVFVFLKKSEIRLKLTVQKWSNLAHIAKIELQKVAMCCQRHSHIHWMFQNLFNAMLYTLNWRWCTKFLFLCEVHCYGTTNGPKMIKFGSNQQKMVEMCRSRCDWGIRKRMKCFNLIL